MNTEEITDFCTHLPYVTADFPFGEQTLVFRVAGKLFLLLSLDTQPPRFNAKCEPQKALELRERYGAILPGYHMNKTHWNTVVCDGSLPNKLIKECIQDSYWLIFNGLPVKVRKSLHE